MVYQAGKGDHHAVSTLLSKDTDEGLKMLASEEVRQHAGVAKGNK